MLDRERGNPTPFFAATRAGSRKKRARGAAVGGGDQLAAQRKPAAHGRRAPRQRSAGVRMRAGRQAQATRRRLGGRVQPAAAGTGTRVGASVARRQCSREISQFYGCDYYFFSEFVAIRSKLE